MENEKKETLVDHWLRRAKNQPVFAIVFVASIVAGSVVSLTDSVSKVSKLVWPGTSESQPQKQKPDYSRHALLWNPAFLHPVLRENTEKLRVAASEQKIFGNLQYYETYRSPEAQLHMPSACYCCAWTDLKQLGLSVTLLPYESGGWIDEPPAEAVQQLVFLAATLGLFPASTAVPEKTAKLTFTLRFDDVDRDKERAQSVVILESKSGRYPKGGDRSWATNLNNQIGAWSNRPVGSACGDRAENFSDSRPAERIWRSWY